MVFIHPLTLIYIVLGLITNHFHGIIFLYLFGIIHELCHVITAYIFHVKTNSIVLYPTGFKANLDDYSSLKIYKQLLILIAGPLSFFISLILINILFHFDVISIYGKKLCENYNMIILLFNILPIYPLDGGKILDILSANVLNEFSCRILRIIISFITLVCLAFYIKSLGDLLMILFVISSFITSFIHFRRDCKIFLIKRKFMTNNYKARINKKIEIFRYKDNYYIEDRQLMDEKKIIDRILDNK